MSLGRCWKGLYNFLTTNNNAIKEPVREILGICHVVEWWRLGEIVHVHMRSLTWAITAWAFSFSHETGIRHDLLNL